MVENGQTLRKILVLFLEQNLDQGRQQIPAHTSHYVLQGKKQRVHYGEQYATHLNTSQYQKPQLDMLAMYLILFIQDNTEDLCSVSLLDAGLPRNCEDVVILAGVAVIREALLCERETYKTLNNNTDI